MNIIYKVNRSQFHNRICCMNHTLNEEQSLDNWYVTQNLIL